MRPVDAVLFALLGLIYVLAAGLWCGSAYLAWQSWRSRDAHLVLDGVMFLAVSGFVAGSAYFAATGRAFP